MANIYLGTSRFAEAEPLLRRALVIQERAFGPEQPQVNGPLYDLSVVLLSTGRPTEAEPFIRRALAIQERVLGPEHYLVGGSLYRLAQVYLDTGRPTKAEPLLDRALAIFEKGLPAGYPYLATVRENCADLLGRLGRTDEAAALRARAQAPR